MTDKQPEALRLARLLEDNTQYLTLADAVKAAAELRRLHQSEREGWRYADELEQERKRLNETNAELVELLQQSRKHLPIAAASWNEEPEYAIHVKAVLALVADIDAAISKAAGEQP